MRYVRLPPWVPRGGLWTSGKTEPELFAMAFISPDGDQFVIYKCVSSEGVALSFSKNDEMTYKLGIRGLVDFTRPKGDQLGCIIPAHTKQSLKKLYETPSGDGPVPITMPKNYLRESSYW